MEQLDDKRACFEKKRYGSEEAAKQVALDCWRKRHVWLRVYPCHTCGGYHLTRKDAKPVMKPNWRPPAKSARALAEERRQWERKRGRR